MSEQNISSINIYIAGQADTSGVGAFASYIPKQEEAGITEQVVASGMFAKTTTERMLARAVGMALRSLSHEIKGVTLNIYMFEKEFALFQTDEERNKILLSMAKREKEYFANIIFHSLISLNPEDTLYTDWTACQSALISAISSGKIQPDTGFLPIPVGKGKRKKIEAPKYDKNVPYQKDARPAADEAAARGTNEECIKLIRNFYGKRQHNDNSYRQLRSGNKDKLSELDYSQLIRLLPADEANFYDNLITRFSRTDLASAMRWRRRGLTVNDSMKKMVVDIETRLYFADTK